MKKICLLILIFYFISVSNSLAATNEKLVAAIPEKGVYLYAIDDKVLNMFSHFHLIMNGKEIRPKDWFNITKAGFPPNLTLKDLNHDGNNELIVVLAKNEESGVYVTEGHVIEDRNGRLNEAHVEDAIPVAKRTVKFQVSESTLTVTVNGNMQVIQLPKEITETNPNYDDQVVYQANQEGFFCNISVTLQHIHIGDISLKYGYKKNAYRVEKVIFYLRQGFALF